MWFELVIVLDYICDGDMLVVIKLDCLVRLVYYLGEIVLMLQLKGVEFCIQNFNIDINIVIGKFMLNVVVFVVQFEREMMLE